MFSLGDWPLRKGENENPWIFAGQGGSRLGVLTTFQSRRARHPMSRVMMRPERFMADIAGSRVERIGRSSRINGRQPEN